MPKKDKRPEQGRGTGHEAKARPGLIMVLVLALIGLGLSIELLRIHLTVEKDPDHPFACHVNEAVDCNAVARSRQAVLLGVPVPVWSILTYAGFIALGITGLRSERPPWKHSGDYCLMGALWCVIYSAFLAYVSAFDLKTFCAYCAGLYAVNVWLLISCLLAARPLGGFAQRRAGDLQWLKEKPSRAGAAVLVLVAGLGVVSALYVWSDRAGEVIWMGEVKVDISRDPMLGYYRAPVTIIEFSDYECLHCRRMHPVLKSLLKKFEGRIHFIHKNYPLNSQCNPSVTNRLHPWACGAAFAAECAHKQGRFESYAERLWTAPDLSEPALIKMAAEEGIDPRAFEECLRSKETKALVFDDVAAGDKLEVTATPSFIINGYKFSGYQDLDWCSRLIERFLNDEPIPPSGEPLE